MSLLRIERQHESRAAVFRPVGLCISLQFPLDYSNDVSQQANLSDLAIELNALESLPSLLPRDVATHVIHPPSVNSALLRKVHRQALYTTRLVFGADRDEKLCCAYEAELTRLWKTWRVRKNQWQRLGFQF